MNTRAYFAAGGWKRIVGVAAIMAAALLAPALVLAQEDCESPLFLQTSGDANCMLLVDNSYSMNEALLHPDYDPNVNYPGLFQDNLIYFIAKDGWKTPMSFNNTWPNTPSAYLVNSDNGEDGRYWGNYLNWVFFHATDGQRAALPSATRIQIAKLILCDIVDRSQRIRWGVTVYTQNSDGGNMIGKCEKNPKAVKAIINGITANAQTPTGESMETILNYFAESGPTAPIEESCMWNFLIVITDGYPTYDRDVSPYLWDADGDGNDPGGCAGIGAPYEEWMGCSDHMDDVAYYMANNDLRPDMPGFGPTGEDMQNLYTYVIGFMLDAPLLSETASNGRGLYFTANNALELWLSLRSAVQDIVRRIASGSAVAVVSTERSDDDRLYRGKFMSVDWDGFLECFQLPYVDGDRPIWDAGNLLEDRSSNSRSIFTAIGDHVYDFQTSQAGNLWEAMETTDDAEAARIILWTRGDHLTGYRDRKGSKLGDIIHSTPVIVGPPNHFNPEEQYQQFVTDNQGRHRMVYIGANDGMLHAFSAENGQEFWAFVPEFALPKLKVIADTSYCHTYTCDGTVTARDVKIGGIWRTVILSDAREGGASIFAMDVTEPQAPTLLWQAALPNGKAFPSQAEFAQVRGVPLVLVGSGLDDTNGEAWLYAYNLETGALLGGVFLSDTNDRNRTSTPKPVDLDLDGETDMVYCADLAGNVWRFKMTGNLDPNGWDISKLFVADEPIQAPVFPAYGENNNVYVYFGSGVYQTMDDAFDNEQYRFYCVYDRHDGNTKDRADLVDQTGGNNDIGNRDGWYVNLWHEDSERVTESAIVVAKTVFFTAYAPNQDVCGFGGHSWLYRMAYDDGTMPKNEDGEEVYETRDEDLGEGVASRPVVDIINETVIVQSSDASIEVSPIEVDYFFLNVRAWQESYDFVNDDALNVPDPPVVP
jgi:type IV pilus assembly protein PilY1